MMAVEPVRHRAALGAVLVIDALLFWPFLTGARVFIGNADRFNHYLSVLYHYAQAAARHQDAGWDRMIFGGWNTLGLPWIFPAGQYFLLGGGGVAAFLWQAGLIAFFCYLLSGLSAYLLTFDLFRSAWLSLVGAVLYQCAFASTLRITQNDQTFAVLALAPFLLWSARRAVLTPSNGRVALLALGCSILVWFTFLQEAAYVALMVGAYLLYLMLDPIHRRRAVFAALGAAAGLATGLPRLWLVGAELRLLVRQGAERSFEDLFQYQNVRPWELLRFFDGTIFGRNPAETSLSNLNFSEGFQLFTSQAVPFLLLAGALAIRRGNAIRPGIPARREMFFFVVAFLCTAAVIGFKWSYHLVYLGFGGMDFHHTRVIVAGLAPLVILAVAALARCGAQDGVHPSPTVAQALAGVGVGAVCALGIHALASIISPTAWLLIPGGRWHWVADPNLVIHLRWQALVEITLTGGTVLLISQLALRGWPGRLARWRPFAAITLGALAATQAVFAAHYQLQGAHTASPIPFESGNSWHPPKDSFHLPTAAELSLLHDRLESTEHRVAVINLDDAAGGLQSNCVARFFDLELVDGYGTGVPQNLAWLPWAEGGLRMREIHLTKIENLPWRSLALTGVKHVWAVDRRLFTADPARLDPATILTNPLRVVPLVFFPQALTAGATAESCEAWMLIDPKTPRLDVLQTSIVRAQQAPAAGGAAEDVRGMVVKGNTIEISLTPSAATRFVVLNSRWHPGWSATADGRKLTVYETNGFMMGLPIPSGVSRVNLEFHPFRWPFALAANNASVTP